jgi:hypothetical protein
MRALKTALLVAAGAVVCWGTLTYGPRVWGAEGGERRIGAEDVKDSARKCVDAVARAAQRARDACEEVTSRLGGEEAPETEGSGADQTAKADAPVKEPPQKVEKRVDQKPLSLPEMSERLSEMISLAKKFNAKVAEATREAPREKTKKTSK